MEDKKNNLNNMFRRGPTWSTAEYEDLHEIVRTAKTFDELNTAMIAKGYQERSPAAYHMQLRTLAHVWRDIHYALFESLKSACDKKREADMVLLREKKKRLRDKITAKVESAVEKKLRQVERNFEAKLRQGPEGLKPATPKPEMPKQATSKAKRSIVPSSDWITMEEACRLTGYTKSNISLINSLGFIVANGKRYSVPALRAYVATRNVVPGNPKMPAPNPAAYDRICKQMPSWLSSDETAEVLGRDRLRTGDSKSAFKIEGRQAGRHGRWSFPTQAVLKEADAGVHVVRQWQSEGYVFGGPMNKQPRMTEAEHQPRNWYKYMDGTARRATSARTDRTAAPTTAPAPAYQSLGKVRFDPITRKIVEDVPTRARTNTTPGKSARARAHARAAQRVQTPVQTAQKADKDSNSTREWVMESMNAGLLTKEQATAMLAKLR